MHKFAPGGGCPQPSFYDQNQSRNKVRLKRIWSRSPPRSCSLQVSHQDPARYSAVATTLKGFFSLKSPPREGLAHIGEWRGGGQGGMGFCGDWSSGRERGYQEPVKPAPSPSPWQPPRPPACHCLLPRPLGCDSPGVGRGAGWYVLTLASVWETAGREHVRAGGSSGCTGSV